MIETYTVAKFWKCAMQVNPSCYIAYCGHEHGPLKRNTIINLLTFV